MINFIDEKGVKHSAIVECKKTKGVNGEKSLSGTIYTNDEILEGIGRGWRLEFENEKYCLTYVYPIDEGNRIVVEFDAVHEFFFDLNKKVVYSELNGSNTAKAYLDLIFNGSGYSYLIEVNVPAFEKEGFGMRNRLDLFKEFISDTGVEFSVNGKVVRILEKVGSNLSTIVKKGFNLNELRIEKDPGSFITYKKGFGAWHDDDDHSKGRLEVEYLSPLASIYGKLEGDPIVDERYKVASNFLTRLKNDVESSYGISVDIDMEDLTKAGYEYEQPHEGDYIMAINKDLGFEQKIRIMSYETSYDTNGNIIDHKVSCGSDNIIRKSIKEDDEFRKEVQEGLEGAISTSNKAWVSANGKNAVFEGPNEPTPTAIGDIWYQIDGEEKIMRIWNGYEWKPVFNPGVIEETIKDLDEELGLTTTTANDAVNKAEQAIRDAGFANSSITAANGQIASLEQNLEGFQQVVQNTYADKTTVTALATQWTQTTELANGHTSQISSLGDNLNLRVTNEEVDEKILADKMIKDTRNDNQTPLWYWQNHPRVITKELKLNSVLGILDAEEFATLESDMLWSNYRAGSITQTAKTNAGVYQRRSSSNSSWGAWSKIADTSNIISQINISPESILIASKKIQIKGDTYIDNGVIKTAHIADLAVSGAKIANATIASAKIISLDASKITANTLSAITTNTGDLNVSGNLNMATDNTIIKGTYDYREAVGTAYAPRRFVGSSELGRRYLGYFGNVYSDSNSFLGYAETFFGLDYFKMRWYDTSSTRNLQSRIDMLRGNIEFGQSFGKPHTVIGSEENYFGRGLSTNRIYATNDWDSFIINEGNTNDIMGIMLENNAYGFGTFTKNNNLAKINVGGDGKPRVWFDRGVYDRTYSASANMFVTEAGTIGRAVSARKYKTDIQSEHLSKAKNILQINPSSWHDKEDLRKGKELKRYYGFIADEFHELGLTEVVQYGSDGQVEGLAYDRISMYHNVILQDHEKEISSLKTTMSFDIWQLKNEIKELKNEIDSLRQAVV